MWLSFPEERFHRGANPTQRVFNYDWLEPCLRPMGQALPDLVGRKMCTPTDQNKFDIAVGQSRQCLRRRKAAVARRNNIRDASSAQASLPFPQSEQLRRAACNKLIHRIRMKLREGPSKSKFVKQIAEGRQR